MNVRCDVVEEKRQPQSLELSVTKHVQGKEEIETFALAVSQEMASMRESYEKKLATAEEEIRHLKIVISELKTAHEGGSC